jgi:hypothetical protein
MNSWHVNAQSSLFQSYTLTQALWVSLTVAKRQGPLLSISPESCCLLACAYLTVENLSSGCTRIGQLKKFLQLAKWNSTGTDNRD